MPCKTVPGPAVPLYPDTDRMYFDDESPTLKLVYCAYAEFPSKSRISTRSSVEVDVRRCILSSPSQNSPLSVSMLFDNLHMLCWQRAKHSSHKDFQSKSTAYNYNKNSSIHHTTYLRLLPKIMCGHMLYYHTCIYVRNLIFDVLVECLVLGIIYIAESCLLN